MLLVDNREPESVQQLLAESAGMDQEAYEGLLLAVLTASIRKVKAGLRHVASEKCQDYLPDVLELGTALDAIDMIANDILHFMEVNIRSQNPIPRSKDNATHRQSRT